MTEREQDAANQARWNAMTTPELVEELEFLNMAYRELPNFETDFDIVKVELKLSLRRDYNPPRKSLKEFVGSLESSLKRSVF